VRMETDKRQAPAALTRWSGLIL
jgi:hypothetical protein